MDALFSLARVAEESLREYYEDDEGMAMTFLSGMGDTSQMSSSSPSSPSASPPSDFAIKNDSDARRGRGRPRKHRDSEDTDFEEAQRGRPLKKKKELHTTDWSDDSDSNSGHESSNSERRNNSSGGAAKIPSQNASMSVRRVPCFFASCTHSYRRPNSTIVEFSDRPLVLEDNYNGYTIRSCKKHHDWWRNAQEKETCEICRGLNQSIGGLTTYKNKRNVSFHVCGTCAYRQAGVLGINGPKDQAAPATEPITLPGPTRFSPSRSSTLRRSRENREKKAVESLNLSLPRVTAAVL